MKPQASLLQAPARGFGSRLERLQARLGAKLGQGLYSRSLRYGLLRDLAVPLERPTAKIPIEVRPMRASDLDSILAIVPGRTSPQEKLEIAWRHAFFKKGAQGCYVAVDGRDGTPCYMQWLMGVDQNPLIRRLGTFPELKADEALLENAYTPASHRGLGIMSAAMALIAEHAADLNARYVLTFVEQSNIASLKGCQRAGFHPHMLHHQAQFGLGLSKRNRFEVMEPTDPRRSLRF